MSWVACWAGHFRDAQAAMRHGGYYKGSNGGLVGRLQHDAALGGSLIPPMGLPHAVTHDIENAPQHDGA